MNNSEAAQQKQNYVRRIRATSCYPAFRTSINVGVILLYMLGGLLILGGIINGWRLLDGGDLKGLVSVIIGIVSGFVLIVVGRVGKDVALMVTDIADSLLDLNSRYEQQQ